ncbi:glycerophosphoryl diester phosphodiesterase membrane domain-containing protein [Quadrisphaera granulorum]|nr:glycerophosphoryl diester phosphodiesterase membrane domain-containing protein [Quadrisphaera granulorum]
MSESPGWTAPGAGGQQPPPPPPPLPSAPQQPVSGWGQPAPVPGGGSWAAPAPRPGIIPLRPLSLGELWDGAFRAVRSNPKPLLGGSAAVVVTIVLVQSVVQGLTAGELFSSLADPTAPTDQVLDSFGSSLPGFLGGLLLSVVLSLVATAALSGLVTVSVSTAVLGRRTPGGELWRRVRERFWSLVGVSLVFSLVPGLAVAALVAPGLVLLTVSLINGDGATVGVLLTLLGSLGAVVLGLWLTVRLLLAPCALVLEGQGVGGAIKRSWALSRRGFWRLLGIWLLTAVCIGVVASIVLAPFNLIATVVGAVVGIGSPLYFPITLAITGVGSALVYTVVYPLQSAVTALLYVDQRMRQEGLDVELARSAAQ